MSNTSVPCGSLANFIMELASSNMETQLLKEFIHEVTHISYDNLIDELRIEVEETNKQLGPRDDLYLVWVAPSKLKFKNQSLLISMVEGDRLLVEFENLPGGSSFWVADAEYPGGGIHWRQVDPTQQFLGGTAYTTSQLTKMTLKSLIELGFSSGA